MGSLTNGMHNPSASLINEDNLETTGDESGLKQTHRDKTRVICPGGLLGNDGG